MQNLFRDLFKKGVTHYTVSDKADAKLSIDGSTSIDYDKTFDILEDMSTVEFVSYDKGELVMVAPYEEDSQIKFTFNLDVNELVDVELI